MLYCCLYELVHQAWQKRVCPLSLRHFLIKIVKLFQNRHWTRRMCVCVKSLFGDLPMFPCPSLQIPALWQVTSLHLFACIFSCYFIYSCILFTPLYFTCSFHSYLIIFLIYQCVFTSLYLFILRCWTARLFNVQWDDNNRFCVVNCRGLGSKWPCHNNPGIQMGLSETTKAYIRTVGDRSKFEPVSSEYK